MRIVSLLLLSAVLLAGCTQTETITCYDSPAGIKLTGFDSAEVAAVELRSYKGNGQFDSLLNSYTFRTDLYTGAYENGTLSIYRVISDSMDMEVVVPAAGKTYRVQDIVKEAPHQETVRMPFGSKVGNLCVNEFLSYTLDGVPHQWGSDKQFLVLTK